MSSATLRTNPEVSALIFPYNGLADQELAYATFAQSVKGVAASDSALSEANPIGNRKATQPSIVNEEALQCFAYKASPLARKALLREPLAPRAYAILALSETNPKTRRRLIALSSQLNRRDLALQGLRLQQNLADQNFPAMIETLDQIMRVHPERRSDFFPLLVEALAAEETVPTFAGILGKFLPWRDAFLSYAVSDQNALTNLAKIRARVDFKNQDFDRQLIANLVSAGEIQAGYGVYSLASSANGSAPASAGQVWQATYPPFDWQLTDRRGVRAQLSASQDAVEFEVDRGNGGVIASKLIASPTGTVDLAIAHQIEPEAQRKDVKVVFKCWGSEASFFEAPLSGNKNTFALSDLPKCPYLEVSIVARAWSDMRPLTGTMSSFTISERNLRTATQVR